MIQQLKTTTTITIIISGRWGHISKLKMLVKKKKVSKHKLVKCFSVVSQHRDISKTCSNLRLNPTTNIYKERNK